MDVIAVVLAAGQGKRMNSSLPKVAHLLAGKPLIIWTLESLIKAAVKKIVVVISPTQKLVEEIISKHAFDDQIQIKFAYQSVPLGTGHAVQCGVKCVRDSFVNEAENKDLKILVAYGDTPAVKGTTFQNLLMLHNREMNDFTVLGFLAENPFGYGRIIREKDNNFVAIREEKDCSADEKKITLCNSGFLCANFSSLEKILPQLKNINAANEYYLTDVPFLAKQSGEKTGVMIGEEESEFLGVNSQEQLAEMEKMFSEKCRNRSPGQAGG